MSDETKFWRLPQLEGVELLRATYAQQSFARHMHEEFAFGVIEKGNLGFAYRGSNLIAPAGSINLCNAGEYHSGRATTEEGWSYRMFYLHPDRLTDAFAQATGKTARLPFFQQGVVTDGPLARCLHQLHQLLEEPASNPLEQQSLLLTTLVQFIRRHSDDPPVLHRLGRENRKVEEVRAYLEACSHEHILLEELAHIACLSPFHLVRVFQRQVGLPPHAYQTQVRIRRAKALLRQGVALAQVALETGFTDQSHLHRHFKRTVGITPGQFSKNVQSCPRHFLYL